MDGPPTRDVEDGEQFASDTAQIESQPLITTQSKAAGPMHKIYPADITVMAEKTKMWHGFFSSFSFPHLPLKFQKLLDSSGSHFTQEDFDALRERLNATLYLKMFPLVGLTTLYVVIRLFIVVVTFVSVVTLTDEIKYWIIPIGMCMMSFIFTAISLSVPVYETMKFTLQSFNQTNTIVHFRLKYFVCGPPCLKIIAFRVQPCEKYVSSLFKKFLSNNYPGIIVQKELWDPEIRRFVRFCLLRVYTTNVGGFQIFCMAESVLQRHSVHGGRKCICEIIEESMDLAYPLRVRGVDLNWHASSNLLARICGLFLHQFRIKKDTIDFQYNMYSQLDYSEKKINV